MGELIGVLSILEGDVLTEAQRLWRLFETEYASTGVQSFDWPNVTFQAGHCDDVSRLEDDLGTLARNLPPFEIVVDGLAHFESQPKTVYLQVLPTDDVRRVNRAVNEMLEHHCAKVFKPYRPKNWIPHVTVAMKDLTDEAFDRAINDLRDYHPFYRQTISNINLVQALNDMKRIEIIKSVRLILGRQG